MGWDEWRWRFGIWGLRSGFRFGIGDGGGGWMERDGRRMERERNEEGWMGDGGG